MLTAANRYGETYIKKPEIPLKLRRFPTLMAWLRSGGNKNLRNKIEAASRIAFLPQGNKHLDLRNLNLEDLPLAALQSTHATVLTLNENPLSAACLRDLRSGTVTKLRLSMCGITQIDEDFLRHMPALQQLDLSHNRISSVPDSFWLQHDHLMKVTVHNSKPEIPLELRRFPTAMEWLRSGGKKNLRNNIDAASRVAFLSSSDRGLDLINLGLESLPLADLQRKRATVLALNENPLSVACLRDLRCRHVRKLHLSMCGITQIDEDFLRHMPNIQLVDLSHNHISSVPDSFWQQHRKLEQVNLEHNDLDNEAIAHVRQSASVHFSENRLGDGEIKTDDIQIDVIESPEEHEGFCPWTDRTDPVVGFEQVWGNDDDHVGFGLASFGLEDYVDRQNAAKRLQTFFRHRTLSRVYPYIQKWRRSALAKSSDTSDIAHIQCTSARILNCIARRDKTLILGKIYPEHLVAELHWVTNLRSHSHCREGVYI